eukprot:767337-Hanusia_phi.AAC.3
MQHAGVRVGVSGSLVSRYAATLAFAPWSLPAERPRKAPHRAGLTTPPPREPRQERLQWSRRSSPRVRETA